MQGEWLTPEIAMKGRSSILDTVHAVEMASLKDSKRVCEYPLCSVRFPQTGLKMSPKRFCSNECKQQASIIRRAVKLLKGLSGDAVLEILGAVSEKSRGLALYP